MRLHLPARKLYPIIAVVALGIALRLLLLWSRTPGFDESKTFVIAQAPLASVVSLVASLEASPPLYFLLAKLWTLAFHDPLALRVLSLLAGVAALLLFRRLERRLNPAPGLFSMLLAALSSYWIYMSQDARPYALFLAASLAQILLALELRRTFSTRRAALYGLVAVLGLHLHYYYAVLLALDFPLVAFTLDRRKALRWVALHGLLAILYIPWLRAMPEGQFRITGALLKEPLGAPQVAHALGSMVMDLGYLGFLYGGALRAAGVVCLLILGAGVWVSCKRGRMDLDSPPVLCAYHLAGAFLAAKALELAVGFSVTQARYFVFVSPLLYLGLSESLLLLPPVARRLGRATLLLAAGAASGAYFYANAFLAPDLKRLSGLLRGRPGQEVLLYPDSYHYLAMRYLFLPERRHHYIGADRREIDWDALPGYRATMGREEVARLPACLVVDFARRLSPKPLWSAGGRAVAAAMERKGAP